MQRCTASFLKRSSNRGSGSQFKQLVRDGVDSHVCVSTVASDTEAKTPWPNEPRADATHLVGHSVGSLRNWAADAKLTSSCLVACQPWHYAALAAGVASAHGGQGLARF